MKKDELKNQKEFTNKMTNQKEQVLNPSRPNTKECEYISKSAKIDSSATIYPNVFIVGDCVIGKNTVVYSGTTIENSVIGDDCKIRSSVIENSIIKNNVSIGPFAHIRPNSVVEDECKIGNFVEIKASEIKKKTKISHLAYVGDAIVGENTNIGCGVIFANFNGKQKNKIVVGKNCFIGSNCNLIAPLIIENGSYICAGTTLTKNTNEFDFVIGRCRETIKPNLAKKYLKEQE